MTFAGMFHAGGFALVFVVTVAALMALWAILPMLLKEWSAPIIAACAILLWIYANFLFLDRLQLNGRESPLTFTAPLGAWELAAIGVAITAITWMTCQWVREVTIALIILFAAQSGLAATQLWSTWHLGQNLSTPNLDPLWQTSRSGSVFVFILDTLQADVAREVFAAHPGLASQFGGFIFFTDATGVAPTTYPSLPAIHSGENWDPATSLIQQYETKVSEGSFMAHLANAGYHTAQVNPFVVCAGGVKVCTDAGTVIGRRHLAFLFEAARLLDLSLLRAMPYYWKAAIFDGGQLFLSWRLSGAESGGLAEQDLEMMEAISRNLTIDDGARTAKFIHMFSTHPPFVLGDHCRSTGRELADGPNNAAVCSLRAIAQLLTKLKANEALDDALVIITADHGGMRPLRAENAMPHASSRWALLASHASPVIMVRLPRATGSLTYNAAPVSITDIAATVCVSTASCQQTHGVALQHLASGGHAHRRRIYHHYTWRHEFWHLANIPDVEMFEISGPVSELASWQETGTVETYTLGATIDFREGVADEYRGLGWASPEPWGTWTEGPRSSLRLVINRVPQTDLTMRVRAQALVVGEQRQQTVGVIANGERIAEWSFETFDVSERSARIPASALLKGPILHIEFEIETHVSPKDLGINEDTRQLGIGIVEAQITAN